MQTVAAGLIATHSGLRGRPGAELTPEVVRATAAAFAARIGELGLPGQVGVARDARPTGVDLSGTVAAAIMEAGLDVVDFGVVATPTAKLAARRRGLGGVVIVTGSHLAPQWNGVKLVIGPYYRPVDVRTLPPEPDSPGAARGGLRADAAAAGEHADALCASVDAAAVRRAGLAVAVSGGAGAAAALMLEKLGCAARLDADVGLVLDADGDRLELLDERGERLDPEATLALVVVAREARRVVKGADTSRMVDVLTARRGGQVQAVPPGELHLLERMDEWDADLGGEGNGGVVVPEVVSARDGLAAAATILELIASSGTPMSRLAAELPQMGRVRSTLPCESPEEALAMLERLARRFGAELSDPELGVTLERPDGAWALARQSATEPVLRLTVEAGSASAAAELHAEAHEALTLG